MTMDMYKRAILIPAVLLLALALAACVPLAAPGESPVATPVPATSDTTDTTGIDEADLPGAALAAREALGQQLGVDPVEIAVIEAEPTEFTDSCLGLGGPAESCLQAITPGYRIVLGVDGGRYVYHTDAEGTSIREAEAP